jgi:hypothetical protein
MKAPEGGKVVTLHNPGRLRITLGGKDMAASSRGRSSSRGRGSSGGSRSSSRARTSTGQFTSSRSSSRSTSSRASGGGSRGRGRGRGRASGERSNGTRTIVKYVQAAPPAKSNGRGRRGRRRARSYFNNPNVSDVIKIAKQLGLGGAGAFLTSTINQISPVQIESKYGIAVLQLLYALGVGWVAEKVLGKDMGATVRIGAFAFVAGNMVQMFAPTLQQRLIDYSPLKPAATAQPQLPGGNVGTPLNTSLSDVEDIVGLGDVYDIPQGEFGY